MIKNKLDNCRETCIFVGYAEDHAGNVYQMFNPQTKCIWITHDIRCIKSNTMMETDKLVPLGIPEDTKDVEDLPMVEIIPGRDNDDDKTHLINHGTLVDAKSDPMDATTAMVTMVHNDQVDACVLHKMKHLGEWFNPTALAYIACSQKGEQLAKINEEVDYNDTVEDTMASRVGRGVANAMLLHAVSKFTFYSAAKVIKNKLLRMGRNCHFVEPNFFVKHSTTWTQFNVRKWHTAIHKEFHDMTSHGIWHKVKQSQIPAGWHCIECKLVQKVKWDGVFCACLMACGYSLIPGLDFSEKHALVINDVAWWILLIAKLVWNLDAILIDVNSMVISKRKYI